MQANSSVGPEQTHDPKFGPIFGSVLRAELLRRCRANPRYSLRAFAKALDYDVSSLSKVIHGKRLLGPRTIQRLGERLRLESEIIRRYIYEEKSARTRPYAPEESAYHQLTIDTFEVISDWYHYAILELLAVEGFRGSPSWIARALEITVRDAEKAILRLKRVGLLQIAANQKWVELKGDRLSTVGSASTTIALRQMQKQLLGKAVAAIDEIRVEDRDHSSMTMAVDSQQLAQAKEKIKKFRRELCALLKQTKKRDAVYALTISLFPLSKGKKRHE